jgi:GT2 family glycosyltransferase
MAQISVLLACHNAAKTVDIQLSALAAQQWSEPWELIVIDNRSTDASMTVVESYKDRLPGLKIIRASAKPGQAHALNVGARHAAGVSLAICDADDEVAPGWLAAMGEALSKHEFVACRIDTRKLNPPWIATSLGEHPQLNGLQRNWFPPYLPHAGAGTLGIRKAVHEAVGGFDESFLYLHDPDYCLRVQLMGVPLQFAPEALAYIRYRHELSAIFHQARHWAQYSVKLYLKYSSMAGGGVVHPWVGHIQQWQRLLLRAPKIRRKRECALFLFNLGWQIGVLQGSLRYRSAPTR